jgi:hypothetical protein
MSLRDLVFARLLEHRLWLKLQGHYSVAWAGALGALRHYLRNPALRRLAPEGFLDSIERALDALQGSPASAAAPTVTRTTPAAPIPLRKPITDGDA